MLNKSMLTKRMIRSIETAFAEFDYSVEITDKLIRIYDKEHKYFGSAVPVFSLGKLLGLDTENHRGQSLFSSKAKDIIQYIRENSVAV